MHIFETNKKQSNEKKYACIIKNTEVTLVQQVFVLKCY